MADEQNAGGIQGLLDSLAYQARKTGHHWLPGFVDAPPRQAPTEAPTDEQVMMAQQAAAQAAQARRTPQPSQAAQSVPIAQQPAAQPRFSFNVGPTAGATNQNASAAQQNAYRADYKQNPNAYIWGYRYYEGNGPKVIKKGPLETVRTYFPVAEMKPYLDVYKLAKGKFGLPKLTPEQFAAMALAESRTDFGYNRYDVNQPHLQKLFADVKNLAPGISDEQAGFIAALREKNDLAKKYGKSFDEIWNGDKVSKYGRSGKQHAGRVKNTRDVAVPHKQNEQLRKWIADQIALMNAQKTETAQAAKGGSIGKPLPGGNKII